MKLNKIIYTLSHPETDVIVYVGITQDLENRLRNHYNSPSKVLKSFIDDLKEQGLHPIITEVDRGGPDLEDRYIKKFKFEGHPLLNTNSLKWLTTHVRRKE